MSAPYLLSCSTLQVSPLPPCSPNATVPVLSPLGHWIESSSVETSCWPDSTASHMSDRAFNTLLQQRLDGSPLFRPVQSCQLKTPCSVLSVRVSLCGTASSSSNPKEVTVTLTFPWKLSERPSPTGVRHTVSLNLYISLAMEKHLLLILRVSYLFSYHSLIKVP